MLFVKSAATMRHKRWDYPGKIEDAVGMEMWMKNQKERKKEKSNKKKSSWKALLLQPTTITCIARTAQKSLKGKFAWRGW